MKLNDLLKTIQKTNDAAAAGVWVPIPRFGLSVKLARAGAGNKAFQRALDRALEPFRDKKTKKVEVSGAGIDQMNKALHKVYAETVVLDWDVKDDNGDTLAYSAEQMTVLFDESHDLFADVQEEAAETAHFYDQAVEEDAKN